MKKGAFIVMLLALCSGADAEILFQEDFEDTNFASRGWYDHLRGTVTTAEHVKGSTAAFECTYLQGQTSCEHGAPGRRLFEASDTVYLSYWVKYSSNFIGSGKAYHPHEFHFLTNKDGIYVGPANSHLSTYTEQVGGRPMLAIQDSRNVNTGCIVHQNDPVGKCDGYAYGEQRSVASCNGIVGYLDSRTCYYGGYWYSARAWYADDVYFKDTPGPYYKNDWHYVEAMFQMNSIADGKGIPDARIRYWYDGELLISSDNILLRTGANADMQFNQFFTGFYIGDGSPRTQTMWVDNLTLSTQRIPYPYSGTVCGDGVCNSTETCETCPEDCGPCCGDGTCAHYENCSTCQEDCGYCGTACSDDAVCASAVFCSGFEEGKGVWDDYDGNPDTENQIIQDPGPCSIDGNSVMRFRVPPGRGGSDLVKVLPREYDRLYARWYQSWEPGYDFSADNHGSGLFAGSRNYLGRSGIRPEGSDSMISTFEPLAGTDDLAARPNLYTYYRGMYQDCTDPDGACWGDHLPCMVDDGYYCEKPEHRQPGLTPKLETGRWYCIEMMVDMGTPVQSDSLADGIQNFWIDGVEYGPWTGLWHRTTPSLKLSILWLSLFHHGEHSVEGVMFDNLVVSESRIGCLGAPPPAARCTDADANEDGSVSNTEMLNYVRRWKVSAISLADLIMTISKWKNGCQ